MRRQWIQTWSVSVVLFAVFVFLQIPPAPKYFSDFVPPGVEIAHISSRNMGNGELYVTTNPEVIRHFTLAMQDVTFTATRGEAMTGNSGLSLSDKNGDIIASFADNIAGVEEINGEYYFENGINEEELRLFYEAFRTENNVVKGK